jgi:hypothetical protein
MREDDPISAWLRHARAQRRVGVTAACACGEARPFALISARLPPICFRCDRIAQGREPYEANHVFGKRSSDLTIRYPVNDHRAVLSVGQYRWPPQTLENSDGDPFLAAAARFRGLYDNFEYMLRDCLEEAQRLEHLSVAMRQKHGPHWWTEAPPEKANVLCNERFQGAAKKSRGKRSSA